MADPVTLPYWVVLILCVFTGFAIGTIYHYLEKLLKS